MRRSQTVSASNAGAFEIYRHKLTTVLESLRFPHPNPEEHTRLDYPWIAEAENEFARFCGTHLRDHRADWREFLARQVSDALDRLDRGIYGRCIRCGHVIASNRLAALPWVNLCAECQEERAGNQAV